MQLGFLCEVPLQGALLEDAFLGMHTPPFRSVAMQVKKRCDTDVRKLHLELLT